MDGGFMLPLKEAHGIAHFGAKAREGVPANIGHSGIALLDHEMGSVGVECAVGGERLGKMFAAVIEGASQGELAVTTDQHCALQMPEIEQEESFLLVDVRIGNFERVKRTNLRQLH